MSMLFFSIDTCILQWGYCEHHAHNRLKQDAHITLVKGGGNQPNGVQNMLFKTLYYHPSSCSEPLLLAVTHITCVIPGDLWTYKQIKCKCIFLIKQPKNLILS